jgi:adenosylcobinamide kinase/adenosylcobinamide-phosphate guanylyltransferase
MLTLVTGGCRSGKSAWAQRMAEARPGPRVYIATGTATDDEMRARVERHRAARAARGWHTVEETVAIADALRAAADCPVVLVDCLTLWVSNLMHAGPRTALSEDDMVAHGRGLVDAARAHGGTVVVVTNEVGDGIVPANALARRYRDLAGRCNQTVAAGADAVVLMTCGIPLYIKGEPPADGRAAEDR